MTTNISARQPAGIPAGGQFAATVHTEPGIVLSPDGAHFVTTAELFTLAQEEAAKHATIEEFDPATKSESKRLLVNRRGLPGGRVRRVNLDYNNAPDSKTSDHVEVAGPSDGRPIIVEVTSGLPRLRVSSGRAVIAADSGWGNSVTVGPGAEAIVISSPESKVTVTVEDGGYAAFLCTSEKNRFRAYPEGDGRVDVMYGTDPERRPYERSVH